MGRRWNKVKNEVREMDRALQRSEDIKDRARNVKRIKKAQAKAARAQASRRC